MEIQSTRQLVLRRLVFQAASAKRVKIFSRLAYLNAARDLQLSTTYFFAPITASFAAFATRNLMTVFAGI